MAREMRLNKMGGMKASHHMNRIASGVCAPPAAATLELKPDPAIR